ncbi:3833_t:CDS:1, partial [Gigaspora rosea]
MPNYSIQTFYLTTFAEVSQQSNENPVESPIIFEPYTFRNEINQNLSNALSTSNVTDSINEIVNPSYCHLTSAFRRLVHLFDTKILSDYP